MKASRKLTTIKKNEGRNGPQSFSRNLIPTQCSQSVSLNLRFLYGMNGYDFAYISKLEKKKHIDLFSNLQRFIYEFCGETDLSKAIQIYTSRKGSKIRANQNKHVSNIIQAFQKAHPDYSGLVPDNTLLHIHTKRNGKDGFVLFGTPIEDTFYVLALDPEHDF